MKFDNLISVISETHSHLQAEAAKSVNRLLTARNWLIGFYIVEYEQNGEDRAKYGEKLLKEIETALSNEAIKGVSYTSLNLFRQFYLTYPQILQSLTGESRILQSLTEEFKQNSIWRSATAISGNEKNVGIIQTPAEELETALAARAKEHSELSSDLQVPPKELITRLSFTHFVELMKVEDALKRTFYEISCIKGGWSVRELKRQIHSLYFERSGLSKKPELLSEKLKKTVKPENAIDIIKNVYAFEFLGLPDKNSIEESELEQALLDNIQAFLLELGYGFCLEARQRRILIGDEYFFVDLVFYHRILKCHVLIDLKMEAFKHANAGQLNMYLNYFKDKILESNDNPPVGILLVTHKNEAVVQYATAGMDQNIFVQKYLVELPDKQQLENFIQNELKRL